MVSLSELQTDPGRFQHRTVELDNAHVADLTDVARRGEQLDRMTVWEDDDTVHVVLDGHHRYEAYQQAGWNKKVPVTIHMVSEEEAQLLAIAENAKPRKQMSQDEKSNWAWRMVCEYPEMTIAKIAEGPVSPRNVKYMRKVKDQLQMEGQRLPSTWKGARMLTKDGTGEWDEVRRKEAEERKRHNLREAIRTPLALAAEHHPDMALEVVREIMGKNKFVSAMDWLGYREMTEAEIENEVENAPF